MSATTAFIPTYEFRDGAISFIPIIHGARKNRGETIRGEPFLIAHFGAARHLCFRSMPLLRKHKLAVVEFLLGQGLKVEEFSSEALPDEAPPRPAPTRLEGEESAERNEWLIEHLLEEFCDRFGVLGRYTGSVDFGVDEYSSGPNCEPRFDRTRRVTTYVRDAFVGSRVAFGKDRQRLVYLPHECANWDARKAAPAIAEGGAA